MTSIPSEKAPVAKSCTRSAANVTQPHSKGADNVIDLTSSPAPAPAPAPAPLSYDPNGFPGPSLDRPPAFQPRSGAKRLVIKNLRTTPRVSAKEYSGRVWAQLDEALTAIFGGKKVPHSLEELYRGVENVCRQDGAPDLFASMRARCEEHVEVAIKCPLIEVAASGRSSVEMLRLVHNTWMTWNAQMVSIDMIGDHWSQHSDAIQLTIRSIFFYMDRAYLLSSRTDPTINEMAVGQFRTHIFADRNLKAKILQGMCDLVLYERTCQHASSDSSLLRQSTDMVHELSVYSSDFEPRLIKHSESYYNAWATEKSGVLDLAEYVEQCDKLMQDEMARCEMFSLDPSTRRDLASMLDDSLVKRRVDVLTRADELAKLLDSNAVSSLEQVYSLLQRVRLHGQLQKPWESYIRSRGGDIVGDEERESEMVVRLLEFKTKLDIVWRSSFHKHEELGHGLREAFASFINERRKGSAWNANNSKPGEMIAKYVDLLLRGGAKAIPAVLSSICDKRLPSALSSISGSRIFGTEDEDSNVVAGDEDAQLSQQLDQVLDLFRFIEGKDVFEAFYKKDLARRLLMARSASADAERTMLTRLKNGKSHAAPDGCVLTCG